MKGTKGTKGTKWPIFQCRVPRSSSGPGEMPGSSSGASRPSLQQQNMEIHHGIPWIQGIPIDLRSAPGRSQQWHLAAASKNSQAVAHRIPVVSPKIARLWDKHNMSTVCSTFVEFSTGFGELSIMAQRICELSSCECCQLHLAVDVLAIPC